MRPKGRWPDAHLALKRLYDTRVPEGMSQEEFGAAYGIGSQGMVWQYLHGYRPLGIEAAAKFATGLRCTIADISPEMAAAIRSEIYPVLGRIVAKAAMLLLMTVPPLLPTKAEASFNIIISQTTHWLRRRLWAFWARRTIYCPYSVKG